MRPLSSPDIVGKAMDTLKGRARVKRAKVVAPRAGIRAEDQFG